MPQWWSLHDGYVIQVELSRLASSLPSSQHSSLKYFVSLSDTQDCIDALLKIAQQGSRQSCANLQHPGARA